MGDGFADRYSFLHFATGIVAYFLGVSFLEWFIVHGIFELVENTKVGVRFIDRHLSWFWPGGKQRADGVINSLGDHFFALSGWYVMYAIYGPRVT